MDKRVQVQFFSITKLTLITLRFYFFLRGGGEYMGRVEGVDPTHLCEVENTGNEVFKKALFYNPYFQNFIRVPRSLTSYEDGSRLKSFLKSWNPPVSVSFMIRHNINYVLAYSSYA